MTLIGSMRLDRWEISSGSLIERNLTTGALLTDDRFPARSGWRPTGRIGTFVAASESLNLRGALYAAWRMPTLNELFRPFEQRSANRSGVGLGLAFSRWGAEANDGRIYARNLPGKGCVFTVDLPRLPVPASEVVVS